ncbi:hypothetical protein B0H16DRAFT_1571689 [Mycena metata]|uniref:Uncharacterized protein n=1 Tax=Mycena metata TaxID=1033252 RepID=A0AAD7I8Z3_9AGAR|nr:hypothetical protein B0H16DRAFT_1571689 [Mycena metata]
MSLSSYIKRQSRVARRSRALSIIGLASILEDPEPTIDLTSNPTVEEEENVKTTKKNSMKARRRLGVSDLAIPRTSALFTAVQGVDDDAHAEWRLRLSLSDDSGDSKDDTESFDFPRPPLLDLPSDRSGSSSSSYSGSSSSSSSSGSSNGSDSVPTTPTPSPTLESYAAAQGQCVVRCKSIKPLMITKRSERAVSPVPAVPIASTPRSGLDREGEQNAQLEDDQDEEDMLDDYYYASHARSYITLSPPLPPSFPRRESVLIPATSSSSTHRPPPIVTHSRSSSSATITRRLAARTRPPPRTPPSRPPPRTPVPTDAVRLSGASYDSAADLGEGYADYVAYVPLPESPELSSNSAARLAALLSPPPPTPSAHSPSLSTPHTPATPAPDHAVAVPRDIGLDADEWDSEDDEFVYGAAYDEDDLFAEYAEDREEYDDIPLSALSPLVASAPSPEVELEADDELELNVEMDAAPPMPSVPDIPTPAPYTGWHPRPRASQLRLAVLPIVTGANGARTPSPLRAQARYSHAHADSGSSWLTEEPHSPTSPQQAEPQTPATPALRSRWSSSTLSSVPSIRSPHSAASPRTFGFARRYFPRVKASSPSASSAKENGKPRPMGAASSTFPSTPSTPSPKPSPAKPKAKGIGGKKGSGLTAANVRRVLPPSLLMPPSLSMGNAQRDYASLSAFEYTADDAWIGTRPSAPSVLTCASPDVFASGAPPTPFLSPASSRGRSPYTPAAPYTPSPSSARWSYASPPGDRDASEDDEDDMGPRKPIPVEMFLRR